MQEWAESSDRRDAFIGDRRYKVISDRRSKRRIPQVELQCSWGPVLDITSTGMRVMCRRIPKEKWVKFDLNTTVDPLPVQVKVLWAKRLGFRKHEVGLHFVGPSPELDNFIRSCTRLDGMWFWKPPDVQHPVVKLSPTHVDDAQI